MLMPILEERRPTDNNDHLIRTLSTRIAGGRKDVTAEPPRVCPLTLGYPVQQFIRNTGHRRHAGVQVFVAVITAHVGRARHSGDTHRGRLRVDPGHVCRA